MDKPKASIIDFQEILAKKRKLAEKEFTLANKMGLSIPDSLWNNEFFQHTIRDLSEDRFPLFFHSAPPGGRASYTYKETTDEPHEDIEDDTSD